MARPGFSRPMQAPSPPAHALPSAQHFLAAARRRDHALVVFAAAVALVIGGSLTLHPAAPLLALLALAIPLILWHCPRAILYILVAGVCLIEEFPRDFADSVTD